MPNTALFVILAAAILLGLALFAILWAGRLRRASGLPKGQALHADTDPQARGSPLYSARYGLAGTPDYIIETPRGPVPVEVKPTRTDDEPQESHLLQVLAYCLLLEEAWEKRPPYGLLRYKSETFKVDYNRQTRAHIISVIEEMQEAAESGEAHRSHEVAGRCRACAYRQICDEALA